jgi:glycosyltransferase involved in cell wall biosynthesis
MTNTRPQRLRVAIDAQVVPWRNGGVATVLTALIRALGRLPDGDEHYTVVARNSEEASFWAPFLGREQSLVDAEEHQRRLRVPSGHRVALKRWIKRGLWRVARPMIDPILARANSERQWPEVPVSNGFYESLGCDVLHFPWQHYVLCALPTIFNPHDLQHLHYPQFFSTRDLVHRETIYPAGCRLSQSVVVGSQWAKEDIVSQYGVDPRKIQVVPEAPPSSHAGEPSAERLDGVRAKYGLPNDFLLYPAITWPHKNHLRLFEALAVLRDRRQITVPLVCTGSPHQPLWPHLQSTVKELGLDGQVWFAGFVSDDDLRAFQRLARGLIIPSLFEASSLPIFDAWLDGVPVGCSNATALPEQVRDAALLFDPTDVNAIGDAVVRIMVDEEMRSDLRARGYGRLKDFDLMRTAKAYRAVYRRVGRRALTEEDRWLLKWDWMTGTQQCEDRRSPDGQTRTRA